MTHAPKKSSFGMLWAISLFDMLCVGSIMPIFPIIFFETQLLRGASPATTGLLSGLLIAIYPLMQFITTPFVGMLSDRLGRKPLMLSAVTSSIIGYTLFALGILLNNVFLVFAARAIDGAGGSVQQVLRMATADITPGEEKLRKFSLLYVAFGIGIIAGPLLGGLLLFITKTSTSPLTLPFWFSAGLALANLLVIAFFVNETHHERTAKRFSLLAGLHAPFKNKKIRAIFTTFFVFSFGWAFFYQFFQIFLRGKFAYSPLEISLILGYAGIWVVLFQAFGVRILSKMMNAHRMLSSAIFLTSAALLGIYFAPAPWVLYVVVPLLAFAVGTAQPTFSTLISDAGTHHDQGELLGVQQALASGTFAATAILASFSLALSPAAPILLAAIVTAMAGVLFVLRPIRAA